VLLLDEPTTGLDPQARHLIWERLKSLLGARQDTDPDDALHGRSGAPLPPPRHHGSRRMIALDAPRNLIEREIEPQVVEVYGDGVRELGGTRGRRHVGRIEVAARRRSATRSMPRRCSRRSPLARPAHPEAAANLEDVFIKLTGRD
jgi:lipooligosaccharide transport system ATP-binding protein